MINEATIISAIGLIRVVVETLDNVRDGKITNEEAMKMFEEARPRWQSIVDEWKDATK